jgi:excisionase family DNA binding protein
MSDAVENVIMRPKEAAAFLGFSVQYLYKLVEKRKVTAYKPGGRYVFFKQKDLEEFIERGKQAADYILREKADRILNKAN